MPIYEYRCHECAKSFDVLTSFSDRDRVHPCPTCESMKTRVQVSTFAFAGGGDSAPLDFGPSVGGGGGCCGGGCGGCGSKN